jgi:hypothetical protein
MSLAEAKNKMITTQSLNPKINCILSSMNRAVAVKEYHHH